MIDSNYVLESISSQYSNKKVLQLLLYFSEEIELTQMQMQELWQKTYDNNLSIQGMRIEIGRHLFFPSRSFRSQVSRPGTRQPDLSDWTWAYKI